MSDLAAAAAAIGAPEELVERSANARAAATGASAVEILAAWAGGASPTVATASAVSVPSEPDSAPVTQPEADPMIASAVETLEVADTVEPPVAVAVAQAPEEQAEVEPVEAAQIRDRLRAGGRTGAALGLLTGVLVALFSVQWLLPRVGVIGEEGALELVFDAVPNWLILGSALVGIPAGLAIASLSRTLLGLRAPGMRLVSSQAITAIAGAVAGGILGAAVGAVVLGAGEPSPLDPEITSVPVLAGMTWLLFGWVVAGWLIASMSQMIGVPAGVLASEAAESDSIRHRLVSAFAIPAMAALTIGVVVIPLAWVFIQFPGYAPLVGTFVAAGILGFAGLSASRPGMKITSGEFFAAFAGIGIIVLILVSVLFVQGAGHSDEGEDAGSESSTEPEAFATISSV